MRGCCEDQRMLCLEMGATNLVDTDQGQLANLIMSVNEFGDLLTQGLKSIAALEKKDLTVLQQELGHAIGVSVWTIYKWRKGASIPTDARTIRLLASACVRRGRMDHTWLAQFLKPVTGDITPSLIDELCPDASVKTSLTHNLPRRQHRKLIGREKELEDLKDFLSPRHRVGVVCISGGGGVGKTALAELMERRVEDLAQRARATRGTRRLAVARPGDAIVKRLVRGWRVGLRLAAVHWLPRVLPTVRLSLTES